MIGPCDVGVRLDPARVHGWPASSYWSPGVERAQVERQIAGSRPAGGHENGTQAGFARAITDHASCARIDDVRKVEPARGRGIGRQMVRWFVDHPDVAPVRRLAFVTADVDRIYEGARFHAPARPARWMERLTPDVAARLRASPR